MILADVMKNNQTDKSMTYEESLKKEYGCEPFGDWDLIPKRKRNIFFQHVCLPKTYQVEDAPLIETPVHMTFTDFKIVEVDERKKSMDLLTKIWFFWKDDRIKFSPLKVKSVRLPAITKTRQDIWYPLAIYDIQNEKNVDYSYDPIIVKDIFIGSDRFSNYFLLKNIFPPNQTVLMATIKMKIKIACHFDYFNYPFDSQHCSLKFHTENLNITMYDETKSLMGWVQPKIRELIGFDLKINSFSIPPRDLGREFGNDGIKVSTFGMNIDMKRQAGPYLYQYYLPCFIIVITSFFGFIIPLSAIPGRIALVVTQFLTLTNIFIHEMVSSKQSGMINLIS